VARLRIFCPTRHVGEQGGGEGIMRHAQSVSVSIGLTPVKPLNERRHKVLMVDLNNFSTFPTLAIGIITASLRNAGHDVKLISPLAFDVPAAERERAERYTDHLARRFHLSTFPGVRAVRDGARKVRHWYMERPHRRVLAETARALAEKPSAILLSAYLQHYRTVREIGQLAKAAGVPMLLGGPMFNLEGTSEAWRSLPGLTAIVGSEVDLTIPDIVRVLTEGGDLLQFPGVLMPDGSRSKTAPPFRDLNASPVPDFTDFPWDRYRVHIIPMMASRGCQWAKCTFCSDIVSVSGRTFRSRSVESVMHEVREQSRRHRCINFLFLDLKLNSNPHLFRGIVENMQSQVRGAEWIGTVHVDLRPDNGLSLRELKAAVGSGMRRISFGLESGSQNMLDAMQKGSTVEGNSEFIRNAHQAGLSVRATMFRGYPGETAHDLELTAEFLAKHGQYMDRVRYNDFSILEDTPIYHQVKDAEKSNLKRKILYFDRRRARAEYSEGDTGSTSYRKAKARVLSEVYAINRRPVRSSARAFDGLM
jgi:anaerobic magnesium-protoporphyrin IX monomethyl ester cyclase